MITAVSTTFDLTVNSQLLAQELRLLKTALPKKTAQIAILNNILLRAEGDTLYLYATNLEIGLQSSCPATVTIPGSITLPALKLSELVEQFTDAPVHLVLDKGQVKISCGKFSSRLQTLPAEDFPPPQAVEGDVSTLPTAAFKRLIKQTQYAIKEKADARVIDGVQLTLTETFIGMAATDGKRLAYASLPRSEGLEMSVLIPSRTLDALLNFPDDGTIAFSKNDNTFFFRHADRLLTSRVIDGKFPSLKRMLPKDHTQVATVSKSEWAAAIRRVGLVADAQQATYFAFTENLLTLNSVSAEIGDAVEDVVLQYSGPPIKILTSWRYVLDFLDQAVGQTVTVALKDGASPMVLGEGEHYTAVVMGQSPA